MGPSNEGNEGKQTYKVSDTAKINYAGPSLPHRFTHDGHRPCGNPSPPPHRWISTEHAGVYWRISEIHECWGATSTARAVDVMRGQKKGRTIREWEQSILHPDYPVAIDHPPMGESNG